MKLFLSILSRITIIKKHVIWSIVFGIYALFNVLYFTNIIPPIPLSMKELEVFHSVERTSSTSYTITREERPWYQWYLGDTIHVTQNSPAYVYSAVFAPTRIKTQIFHEWFMFDEEHNTWVRTNHIGFNIAGGRDGGYRGYTIKQNIPPGKWRIDVVTERGQVIGRKTFGVVRVSSQPELTTETR